MNVSMCSRRSSGADCGNAADARKRSRPRIDEEYVSRVAGLIRWAVRCRRHDVSRPISSDEAVSSDPLGAPFVAGSIVSWMSEWRWGACAWSGVGQVTMAVRRSYVRFLSTKTPRGVA